MTIDTSRSGECSACGQPVTAHFNRTNDFMGCPDHKPVPGAQLLAMRMRRNAVAREEALKTIRDLPNGRWMVRVGGRVKGRSIVVNTRNEAVTAVNQHYNNWAQTILRAYRQGAAHGHPAK